MNPAFDTLTDKEKAALRLLLRGHDAKSSARELGLSVHTLNERLREARRKLGLTSSREAARRLLEAEAGAPESLGDKALGDALAAQGAAQNTASATQRRAWFGFGPGLALTLAGVLAMSLILAVLLIPASPLSVLAPTTAAEAAAEPTEAASAAEAFLVLWDANRWAEVSDRVRPPLGKLLTRNLVTNEYVPAPPEGYQLVKFASSYADGTNQVESLSLAWEDGAWKVVGIVIG